MTCDLRQGKPMARASLDEFRGMMFRSMWSRLGLQQERQPFRKVRLLMARLLACVLLPCLSPAALLLAQAPVGSYQPAADPAAEVVLGHARFTVLTPRMIRIEWVADARFEDRASFVFLNRRLPVPSFTKRVERRGAARVLHLQTDSLDLTYTLAPHGDGRFRPSTLAVTLMVNGQRVSWKPGMVDPENLEGTTRTLDMVKGGKTREPIGPGLVSRSGWVVVDDSTRPLFDAADFSFPHGEDSPLPWAAERPEMATQADYDRLKDAESPVASAGAEKIFRQDWYFFGYGHGYKQALGDFSRVSGKIPLPPRFAFGA